MIYSDGYTLVYEKLKNKIVVVLPQTEATITTTAGPITKRKVDVPEWALAIILQTVKYVFEVVEVVEEGEE